MNSFKQWTTLYGPIAALISSVWYISMMFHNIDDRFNKIDYNIDSILLQVKNYNSMEEMKYNYQNEMFDEKMKSCGCEAIAIKKEPSPVVR